MKDNIIKLSLLHPCNCVMPDMLTIYIYVKATNPNATITFKIFKNFSPNDWGLTALAAAFVVLSVWMELTIPEYMSEITTLV